MALYTVGRSAGDPGLGHILVAVAEEEAQNLQEGAWMGKDPPGVVLPTMEALRINLPYLEATGKEEETLIEQWRGVLLDLNT